MLNVKQVVCVFCIGVFLIGVLPVKAALISQTLNVGGFAKESPISTQSASVLERGTWWIGLRNDYYDYKSYSNAKLLQFAAQTGRSIESDDYYNLASLTLSYGLLDAVTVSVALPFSRLSNVRTGEITFSGEESISRLGNAQGFGDIGIVGQWLILKNPTYQTSAMVTLGSTVPTGAAHLKDNTGNLFPPLDQPGRGTFAPFIGIAVTKEVKQSAFSTSLLYTQGLRGAQDANLGNMLDYNVAFVSDVYQADNFNVDGVLELNGEYYPKTIVAGVRDEDSGANIIYFSPGLKLNLPNGISPYIAIGLPIMQTANGIQSTVRYMITGGIDFGF